MAERYDSLHSPAPRGNELVSEASIPRVSIPASALFFAHVATDERILRAMVILDVKHLPRMGVFSGTGRVYSSCCVVPGVAVLVLILSA